MNEDLERVYGCRVWVLNNEIFKEAKSRTYLKLT